MENSVTGVTTVIAVAVNRHNRLATERTHKNKFLKPTKSEALCVVSNEFLAFLAKRYCQLNFEER